MDYTFLMKLTLSLCALVVFAPAVLLALVSGWWLESSVAALLLYPLVCGLVVGFEKLAAATLALIPHWNH